MTQKFANRALTCRSLAGLFYLMIVLTQNLMAAEVEMRGNLGINERYFTQQGVLDQQQNILSLSISPEFSYEWNDGDDQWVASFFARIDQRDNDRTHLDVREAYWLHVGDEWELQLGVGAVFWGVIETQHLVDIINQTDAVEGVDGEDKLGQPMAHLSLDKEWGILEFFWMPYFRERTFPSTDGRFLGSLNIQDKGVLYQSSAAEKHQDYALRWSQNYAEVDIAFSWFDGTSRAPQFIPILIDSELALIQRYPLLSQFAVEFQLTHEQWLWKLEAVAREEDKVDYFALSAGLEYSFYGIFETDTDLGLLLEYHYDDRDNKSIAALDNDSFIGFRIAFNNEASTEILTGAIIDNDHQSYAWSLEASSRINDNIKLTAEVRIFENYPASDIFSLFGNEDFFELELNYFY